MRFHGTHFSLQFYDEDAFLHRIFASARVLMQDSSTRGRPHTNAAGQNLQVSMFPSKWGNRVVFSCSLAFSNNVNRVYTWRHSYKLCCSLTYYLFFTDQESYSNCRYLYKLFEVSLQGLFLPPQVHVYIQLLWNWTWGMEYHTADLFATNERRVWIL